MGKVTIKDIAAKAGVSIALVSFVMNNARRGDGKQRYRVGAETRDRILRIAADMNYHPNVAARMLRGGNSKVIGAILPDLSNIFYGAIARFLEDEASKCGYTLLVASTDERKDKFARTVDSFVAKGVDGIVAVPCEGCRPNLDRIMVTQIPLVILDRHDFKVEAPVIVEDGVRSIETAVAHLRELGVADSDMIMLSHTMRVSSMADREKGFAKALGISVEEAEPQIRRYDFFNTEEGVEQLAQKNFDGAKGIIAATNSLAVAVLKSQLRRGMPVQQDVKLVGFDLDNLYSAFNPEIPHMVQPVREMCETACEELFSIMDGTAQQRYKKITFQGVLKK